MFRRSATVLMPKPESEPLLFRPERIRAKTGESGPVPRSPVPSGRKDAAFRAIFPPSPDCMLNLQTVWRRGGDSNPRDPFESTRVPGVRVKPGSATSPRQPRLCITQTRGATGPDTRLLAHHHARLIAAHRPD